MRSKPRVTIVIPVAFVLSIITACTVIGAWRFSVGPVYRDGMEVAVSGSSYVQTLGLHAMDAYRRDPAGVRDRNENRDRTYDDGFVNTDVATFGDDLTWFWGWEDDDQYNAGSQTLKFHRRGGVRVRQETLLDEGMRGDEDVHGVGLAFMAGRSIACPAFEEKGARVELCFGVQGVWNEEAEFQGTTYRERITKEKYTVVDTYDVGYDLTASPAYPPPYEGTYFGPGPLIPNKPSRRDRRTTSRTTWEAENRIDMDVESDLYEFWFGPRISIRPSERAEIYCIPSISLSRVDMDIDRSEQFVAIYSDGRTETLGSWHDSACEDEWLFGVGMQVGAEVDLNDGWFAGAFGGYDWVADDAKVNIGPNTVTLDPSGYTLGIEIGKKL